jgi:hypothetical protein
MSSATGGPLIPSNLPPYGPDLDHILHDWLAGITVLDNTLIRPRWQPNPPALPAQNVNWLAFGVDTQTIDVYPQSVQNLTDATQTTTERLAISLSFYGPLAQINSAKFRSACYVAQNYESLKTQKIVFTEVSAITRLPELVNTTFYNRCDIQLLLSRQCDITYDIKTLTGASGNIYTDISETVTPF